MKRRVPDYTWLQVESVPGGTQLGNGRRSMKSEMNRCRQMIERQLEKSFTEEKPQKALREAMRYSLLAGGKRIRPIITLQFCKASGAAAEKALPFACALEMLHTYSLIHDDLPCMDDDGLRRGKPTNHIVYGEWMATLAGDALQAAAFHTLLKADLPPETVVAAAQALAEAAGEGGICGGQMLDMNGEGKNLGLGEITTIHEMKTASMIIAAAKLGVLAGGGSNEQLQAAEAYGAALGLAFQIRDDMLDLTAGEDQLGKSTSDTKSGKSTFATLLGIEACKILVVKKTDEAKGAVRETFENAQFFCWLADFLAERDS